MDRLPPTYPHIVAFPLAMQIMTERSFPFPLLGLVHIGNEIAQHAADRARRAAVAARARAATSSRTTRGTQFTMAAEARVGRRARVGVAQRVPAQRGGGSRRRRQGRRAAASRLPARAHWRVPGGHRPPLRAPSRATATRSTCTRWSAKLFGMPRPIAHGMWVKARCLAELEPTLPDAFSVDVRFKLPLFLPAQVAFGVARRRRVRGARREQRQAAPERAAHRAHEPRPDCGSRSASWPRPPG